MQNTYNQNEFNIFIMNYLLSCINGNIQTDDDKWNNFISKLKNRSIGTYLLPILDHDSIWFDTKQFTNTISNKDKITLVI